jgi:hypothetical protein
MILEPLTDHWPASHCTIALRDPELDVSGIVLDQLSDLGLVEQNLRGAPAHSPAAWARR